jgi:methylglyoxal reductase
LEQGLLTGKVTLDREFDPEDFRRDVGEWMPWFKPQNLTRLLETFTGWQELLEHYQCSITQLVIAWTALEPRASHVLCGSRSADQVLENAGGGDIVLSDGDAARITTDLDKLGAPY